MLRKKNYPFIWHHPFRVFRNRKGSVFIEAMFSVVFSVIMLDAVFSLYCEARRVGNITQGQAIAQYVAQECIDQLRALPFSTVSANIGTHYAQVNSYQTAGSTDALFPRPLFYDSTLNYNSLPANLTQTQGVQQSNSYLFHTASNGVTQDDQIKIIITSVDSNTLSVAVNVQYFDTSGTLKVYQASSYIARTGLNG